MSWLEGPGKRLTVTVMRVCRLATLWNGILNDSLIRCKSGRGSSAQAVDRILEQVCGFVLRAVAESDD